MANSHLESSAKNTEKRLCGPAVKSHTRPNKGRRFCARRKLRTLRCPWIVVKFLYQLVFYIATAGLIKYILKSGNRAKSRWGTRKLVRYTKNPKQKKGRQEWIIGDCETFQNGARSSQKSRRYRCACTCTHFSHDSESERPTSGIEEAQYFHSLPERSKWRSMLAKQDDKGSLQKTHWRNSTSNRKSLVT